MASNVKIGTGPVCGAGPGLTSQLGPAAIQVSCQLLNTLGLFTHLWVKTITRPAQASLHGDMGRLISGDTVLGQHSLPSVYTATRFGLF